MEGTAKRAAKKRKDFRRGRQKQMPAKSQTSQARGQRSHRRRADEILAQQPRGTLIVRDELAGWLGGMNQYKQGESDRPFSIKAYGGRRYAVDRESKDRRVVQRLTVSLVGGIQPEPLTLCSSNLTMMDWSPAGVGPAGPTK